MKYQLELKNINKSYGDIQANRNINLAIEPASIHALLGENGAGKSTLVNMVYGIVTKDSGHIYWEDKAINISSPIVARDMGIGIVFQHFALFEALSVVENIALGISYMGSMAELTQEVVAIGKQYKLDINPNAVVATLSAGAKQRVEIIRCLLQKPKLLILDEPTSVLTPIEVTNLFTTLRTLKEDGCSILFIGHKLDEIKNICEVATILRHGEFIGKYQLEDTSTEKLAQLMVGSRISEYTSRKQIKTTKTVLQVLAIDNNENSKFRTTNLELKSGNITGIAGIAGNGQDDLLSFLSGETSNKFHKITYNGVDISNHTVRQRNEQGILFVPTERLGRSAVPQMSLIDNALLGVSNKREFVKGGFVNYDILDKFSQNIITKFKVKTPNNKLLASSLSGGNLQKFIVGRTIMQDPKVLIIANPTWGVDISSAIFIRNSILKLRDEGVAILIASEDLDEMFSICDDMAVIKKGELMALNKIKDLSIEKVGLMMTQ